MTTRITSSSKIAFVVSGQDLMHKCEHSSSLGQDTGYCDQERLESRDIPNVLQSVNDDPDP